MKKPLFRQRFFVICPRKSQNMVENVQKIGGFCKKIIASPKNREYNCDINVNEV